MLFGLHHEEIPRQEFKQDEFECLNLNIICPGGLTPESRVPVMLWIHGCVLLLCISRTVADGHRILVVAMRALARSGIMMAVRLSAEAF